MEHLDAHIVKLIREIRQLQKVCPLPAGVQAILEGGVIECPSCTKLGRNQNSNNTSKHQFFSNLMIFFDTFPMGNPPKKHGLWPGTWMRAGASSLTLPSLSLASAPPSRCKWLTWWDGWRTTQGAEFVEKSGTWIFEWKLAINWGILGILIHGYTWILCSNSTLKMEEHGTSQWCPGGVIFGCHHGPRSWWDAVMAIESWKEELSAVSWLKTSSVDCFRCHSPSWSLAFLCLGIGYDWIEFLGNN